MMFQQLTQLWPGWLHRHSRTLGIACLGACLAGMLNSQFPLLRLSSVRANCIAMMVLLLLPWPALFLLASSTRGWRFGLSLVLAMPLLLVGSCEAALTAPQLSDLILRQVDSLFVEGPRVVVGASEVVLYRTDCGPACNFGMELRQERILIPHALKLVRVLGSWDRADGGTVEVSAPGYIRVHIAAGAVRRNLSPDAEIHIRPWLYF
jgi:hypothetical protein